MKIQLRNLMFFFFCEARMLLFSFLSFVISCHLVNLEKCGKTSPLGFHLQRWGVDMKIKFLGGIENLKIKSAFSLPNFSNFPTFSTFFCIFWKIQERPAIIWCLNLFPRNSDKIPWTSRRKRTQLEKITLMLPSQKIKLLNGEPWNFSKPKKIASGQFSIWKQLFCTRSPPEIFYTKFMAQRGAMVRISKFDVIDDSSNPNEC